MKLIDGETVIGEICHIKGKNPDAPRYDPSQTLEERHGYYNLLLMCGTHHTVIDSDVDVYTVERLLKMKSDHEKKAASMPDDVANRAAFLIDASVKSANQSGGIIAHSVTFNNYGSQPPAEKSSDGSDSNTSLERQAGKCKLARLIPLNAREVRLHADSLGVWYEASTDLERARAAIVLPFKNVPNQPGQLTPRASGVSANLIFNNADGSEDMHINHGVWVGQIEYPATFPSGETHELLIALKDVPFVTFENPNAVDAVSGGHYWPSVEHQHPQKKVVHKEGTVEITLIDSHGVTLFQGTFEYALSLEKMTLKPRTLVPVSKIHFVPDTPNCGWARNDIRTDFRVTGTFTYDGEESITVMDAFIKDTTPIAKMMVQPFAGGPLIVSFELWPHKPIQLMLNLPCKPIAAERGKPRQCQLVFSDIYNKKYELDPIELAWNGGPLSNPSENAQRAASQSSVQAKPALNAELRALVEEHKRTIRATRISNYIYRELSAFRKTFLRHGLADVSENYKNFFEKWLTDPMVETGATPAGGWTAARISELHADIETLT